FELCLFTALLFFWIAPGYEGETALFGLAHGLGYLGLCVLILVAILRREGPWPLLAATLTPLGPLGSVIGIELIERRGWGIAASGTGTGGTTGRYCTGKGGDGLAPLKGRAPGPAPPRGTIASELPPWLPTRGGGGGRVAPLPPGAPPRQPFFGACGRCEPA